jgi:hypothetical protein
MTHLLQEAVARNLTSKFEKIREGARRASPPISSAAEKVLKKLMGKAGSRGGERQAAGHDLCWLKRFVRHAAPAGK